MRIVFMGTPAYGAICLQALVDTGHQVVGLFTQPDKPRGRGGKMTMPETKETALHHGIPVFQPGRIRKDGLADLQALAPDLCVTAAYGQILSPEILAVPPLGTVNVHASLLPKYRGSAPANWAIIQGETVTGVTTMMTDAGIDTGDILLQKELAILPDETAGELTIRLAGLGAGLLLETIRRMRDGSCPRRAQVEADATYFPMLKKDFGAIDWRRPAAEIANLVRGVQPWPGAGTPSPWGALKVVEARAEQADGTAPPGAILQADGKSGLLVRCGEGALRITRLQAPGGKVMDSGSFLRGHPLTGKAMMEQDEVSA